MAYKNIVWVKLERRLLNDYRWYQMSIHAQLYYVKFILLAAETYNKIPKNILTLSSLLRNELEIGQLKGAIREIQKNFPKFKSNRYFYYFEDFENKTNWLPPQQSPSNSPAIAQHSVEKKRKEKDKEKIKIGNFVPPTIEEVTNYCKERNNNVDPNKFLNHYQAKGWLIGRNKMKDWKAAVRTWENTEEHVVHKPGKTPARVRVMTMRTAKISDPDIKTELLTSGYSEVEIDEALGRT